ncbi:Sugar kinase of the NBD/HSP70 family, may contain an N-terminal HTH domain [Nocardioides lianchengensis]|uniref:Sugar kinase of the NBD/HSP70 family, may contain an N-terminal HTH domain n=1 Tax=Nocardioides lianchengensis TaxID=1045774 RepID=A0A1G6KWL2_9ACTN|nr:Sugar kinase of the NBD/HSP70 family, may contain an N-terminal HTH domain [Nocardioides lianchengensis]
MGPVNVGLDIGATKTLGVVVDADGRVLAQERLATAPGAEGIVATAVGVVEALAAAAGAVTAVGVGVPGLVDVERGALAHAVNLGVDGEWLPLGDLLASRLGVPVSLENDVNAAALGAVALTGVDDLVYLSIGTGLAAGLVLDGRLRRGVSGAAGEIGHVPVDPAGAACQCGQRGCLETVASGRAITDAWPSGDVPAAQALFAAAAAGDVRAVAVRDRFAAGVADAVRVLGLSLDPGVVMLGGGVAQLGEPLRAAVSSALHDQAIASPFLASLDLAGRLRVVPVDHPVAAVGAALLGPREAVA